MVGYDESSFNKFAVIKDAIEAFRSGYYTPPDSYYILQSVPATHPSLVAPSVEIGHALMGVVSFHNPPPPTAPTPGMDPMRTHNPPFTSLPAVHHDPRSAQSSPTRPQGAQQPWTDPYVFPPTPAEFYVYRTPPSSQQAGRPGAPPSQERGRQAYVTEEEEEEVEVEEETDSAEDGRGKGKGKSGGGGGKRFYSSPSPVKKKGALFSPSGPPRHVPFRAGSTSSAAASAPPSFRFSRRVSEYLEAHRYTEDQVRALENIFANPPNDQIQMIEALHDTGLDRATALWLYKLVFRLHEEDE